MAISAGTLKRQPNQTKQTQKCFQEEFLSCMAHLTTRMYQDLPVGANHLLKSGLEKSQLDYPKTVESIRAINHFCSENLSS